MNFSIRPFYPGSDAALGDTTWDYADGFEILLDTPDDRPAEEWLRTALDRAGAPMRQLIRLIHRHVVRFDLDGGDDMYLGWHLLVSEPDVAAIEADGSLLRAVIVARRHSPTRCTGATYLFFHRRARARLMWFAVKPLHLLVERRLLIGAARAMTARQPAATAVAGAE